METILCLLHTESDGRLGQPALEALASARKIACLAPGAPFTVGIIGENPQPAADSIAGCGGRFLAVSGPDFAQGRYATDAAAAEALCRASACSVVIAPGTSRFARVLPGVAQRLGGQVDTHVTAILADQGVLRVERWFYRQRMEAALQRQKRPWVILVDPGSEPPWSGQAGVAQVQQTPVNLTASCKRTNVIGIRELRAGAQTIRSDAQLLLVAGAGWTKKQADGQTHVKDAEELILGFLNSARASLGSSKSLVDLGGEGQAVLSFLSHLNQVGQTGSTPRHPKGLATCCHGEEPHTVGWRFITERRAINLDPNCGWARGKADVLYVSDAFAVLRKLNELLKNATGQNKGS